MALEFGDRQIATAIVLATLTITAGFTASGVTRLMVGSWFPLEGDGAGGGAGVKVAAGGKGAPGSQPPDIKAILKRNMFDPETGALWPPKGDQTVVESGATGDESVTELAPGAMPPPCEGKLKMIASVYAPNRPDWSFVSLNTGSGDPLLYRLGSVVDGKEVDSIYPKAVFLKTGGALCSLTMFLPPPKKKSKTKAGATKPSTSTATATTARKSKMRRQTMFCQPRPLKPRLKIKKSN